MALSQLSSSVIETMDNLIDRGILSFETLRKKNTFKQILVSQAIEGDVLTEREIIDCKKRIDGEQTNEEFIEKIKAGYYG